MGKIDTSGWKEFHMVDIGFKVYHGSRITKAERVEGDTVFLTAGFENCGVVGTIGNENIDVWEKPITVDMFGNVFYHDETCAGDDNIYAFLNSELSRTAKLFVASSVASVTQSKYSYQQQFRQGDANKLSVYLPATPDGAPDWTYMESYMANLETRVADSLTLLHAAKDAEKKKVDTKEWGEFRVGELFDAERGKVKNIQPLTPGATPIIAAGAYNQGIAGMYDIDSAYKNRITVSCNGAGCGSTFYHPYEFNVNGDAITLIEKKCMSDRAKQFVACILNATFTRKFSYEEKCSPQKALAEAMRLPMDKTGQPDWAYMEEYMRKVERKTDGMLNKFISA